GSLIAGSRMSHAQELAGEAPGRIPPIDELVNAAEFRAVAERKLDRATFVEIEGSERAAFERITFRPRLMIDSRQLNLTTELLGQSLFAPILVGPVSDQRRYRPEGELAMARGAAAAKSVMVLSDRTGFPVEQVAEQAKVHLWYQVYLDSGLSEIRGRVERAV